MKFSEVHALKSALSNFNSSPAVYANLNLPNCLTIARILLIPVFIALLFDPTDSRALFAAVVFAAAALTDLLDGYVARRRGQITNLGKFLDPVADKLLVISGLVLLVHFQRVEVWLVIAMIARELVVTGFRTVAAREGIIVAAGIGGKVKVVCQIIAILCLILEGISYFPGALLHANGILFLYIALIFSLWSGTQYVIQIWRSLSSMADKQW